MLNKIFLRKSLLTQDFIWRAVQVILKEGVLLCLFFYSAYALGAENFGLYSYLMSLIFLVVMFCDFGFSTATSTLVSRHYSKGSNNDTSILSTAVVIILLIALAISLSGSLYLYFFQNELAKYLFIIVPLIFTVPLVAVYDGVFRGQRRFKKLSKLTSFASIISLVSGIYLIHVYGLIGAILSQCVFYASQLIVLSIVQGYFKFAIDKEVLKQLLNYSIILGITGVGYYFFSKVNSLVIGHYGLFYELAHFEMVQKVLITLLIPFTIFAQVIAPRIANYSINNNFSNIKVKLLNSILFSTAASLFISILLYIIFKLFLNSLNFESYNTDIIFNTLIVFIPMFITQSVSTVVATGFSIASGHAKLNMQILLVFGFINTAAIILITGMYGYWGAVYTTALIKIAADIVFIFMYYRIVKSCQKSV